MNLGFKILIGSFILTSSSLAQKVMQSCLEQNDCEKPYKTVVFDDLSSLKFFDLISFKAQEQTSTADPRLGKPIPKFNVKDINGNKYISKDLLGKVIVLNFWFKDCPPCKKEMPELNKLVEKYATNPNIVFLGMGLNTKSEIQNFLKTQPFTYHLIPESQRLVEEYQVDGYPTHFVIDKKGNFYFTIKGLFPNTISDLEKAIEETLQQ